MSSQLISTKILRSYVQNNQLTGKFFLNGPTRNMGPLGLKSLSFASNLFKDNVELEVIHFHVGQDHFRTLL